MNILFEEEFEGELAGIPPNELGDRLKGAFKELASELIKSRREEAAEAGEIAALEELEAELVKGFDAELERIRVDLEKGLS